MLLEFCECFLYTFHCFAYIVITGGVTHAEAVGIAESVAANRGHMAFLKQIHCEVGGTVYRALTIALAVETAAFREQVESTLWHVNLKSGNFP